MEINQQSIHRSYLPLRFNKNFQNTFLEQYHRVTASGHDPTDTIPLAMTNNSAKKLPRSNKLE